MNTETKEHIEQTQNKVHWIKVLLCSIPTIPARNFYTGMNHPSIPPWSKQIEHHCPQLISYREMKKKMTHRLPTFFAHTAPIQNNNMSLLKIVNR